MKTIELNEQQVEVLQYLLDCWISDTEGISRTYVAVANQIINKLEQE